MDRRYLLKAGMACLAGSAIPMVFKGECNPVSMSMGWNPDYAKIKRFVHRRKIQYLKNKITASFSGSGLDRVVLLYKYLEKATGGKLVSHDQEIGDCVGQAYGLGVDILAATQIHGLGLAERFQAKASTETVYAGSRYEIGYLEDSNNNLLRRDGSWGIYAVEFINKYGVLPRGVYGDIDLTRYDSSIARLWGRTGVPDHLEPQIKDHPIRSYALVGSYEECRDAIANGYPVVFCSDVGFNPNCRNHNPNGRDDQGFLNRCGKWNHAMCGVAVDDTDRPGILIQNSWGSNWVGGGTRHGQPEGSFWVDANTITDMCDAGDSYTFSGFLGFPSKALNYNLF